MQTQTAAGYTGKTNLMRRITHREAVFGTVLHSIFDAWQYECSMDLHVDYITTIRMQFCALDTIHHIAYNKLESKLPDALHCTLPSTLLIALDCTLPACLTVHSQLLSMAHSQSAGLTLSSKLSRRSEVHSRVCSLGLFQLHSMAHSQPA